ncbi:MAG: ATP synthase F0 subunit B [Clostridia bacterium]|nr:F0F1 ATP synthase subunit B [Bacilli bacterium]NCB20967.1 ATP synthase F0 subunit B [Clostridia bacterium]
MGLVKALGLDWRILLAQLFNFAVLIWILWRFAYKPVFKILEERRLKVNKGLDDAEIAASKLEEAEARNKQILLEARQEANKILEQAQAKAEHKQEEIIAKAESEIAVIMEKERSKIALEKSKSLNQLREEVSSLVVLSLKKFLEDNFDESKDQGIVERIVANLNDKG